MICIAFLAASDLTDRRILGILIRSLLVTLAIFVGIGILLGWTLNGADPCSLLSDDSCIVEGWMSGLSAVAFTLAALWLLFPAVAFGVVWAYADRIMAAVDARHYPEAAAKARTVGMGRLAWLGLRSALRITLYNLIALPLYILLLVTGVGTLVLFILVNGLAFGQDLGEMVVTREADRDDPHSQAWLRESRGRRFLIGSGVAMLFLVPFLNLIAPVLGAAMVAHLYRSSRA